MNNEILISVIIDAYNYGIYIEDAIVSALQQSIPREQYEIIVVDDGSTDDTRLRVSKYLPDVIYHYKENGGQASAFNAGIAMAHGEFVAFLDADDYWHHDKLREVLKAFGIDPCIDVVYNSMCVVDETNCPIGVTPPVPAALPYAGRPVAFSLHHTTPTGSATSGIAWRRSALEPLLPIPEIYRICADGYLMFCAPVAARKFILLNKPLGCYRIHGKNRYSTHSLSAYAVCAKSDEVASHYRKLFLHDLLRLTAQFEHMQNAMIGELKALCLADDLVAIQKRSGIIQAIYSLTKAGTVMTELPLKIRLFRSVTLLLRLFVPANFYVTLQNVYANSLLHAMVQRYVRNIDRLSCHGTSDGISERSGLNPN